MCRFRRQRANAGVVVGELAGRIVLLQHFEQLGDVGEIARADLIGSAVKAEDDPLAPRWLRLLGHVRDFNAVAPASSGLSRPTLIWPTRLALHDTSTAIVRLGRISHRRILRYRRAIRPSTRRPRLPRR